MNVKLYRILDYYFGIPLCFILTIVDFLRPHRKFGKDSKINGILFVELSEMGSTMLAYSAMHRAQEIYEDAEMYFLTFYRNRESVELIGLIDKENIFTIRDHRLYSVIFDTLRFVIKVNRCRINVVYDLELFSRYSAILCFLSGAEARVGFHNFSAEGLYRGNLLTHKVQYNTYWHMTYNFLALVYSIQEDPREIPLLKRSIQSEAIRLPQIEYDEPYIQQLKSYYPEGKTILVINPDSGTLLPLRNWHIDCFVSVIYEAIKRWNVNVVLVGKSESKECGDYIGKKLGKSDNIINLIGFTNTVNELVHVIHSGDVFLTCDSGPAHFAALTDTPTIVLFGPETPEMYGSLSREGASLYSNYFCSPCLTARNHRNSPCLDNKCLQAITPEKVLREIANWINPS